jgi:hypothetical protein
MAAAETAIAAINIDRLNKGMSDRKAAWQRFRNR